MIPDGRRPSIFIRFGIQRKKTFLKDVRSSYDGLVLPANVLLYQYKSTPSVVFMCDRPFFVDPMSYLFGQPYEEFKQRAKQGTRKFKPSFERLMQGHGLNPEDFLPFDYTALLRFLSGSNKNLETFVNNTLDFERNRVWQTLRDAKDLMSDEQKLELNEFRFLPCFLIPPYFLYIPPGHRGSPPTTELNRRILEVCWRERDNWGDIFPMSLSAEHT